MQISIFKIIKSPYNNDTFRKAYNSLPKSIKAYFKDDLESAKAYVNDNYSISLEPRIIRYKESEINSNNMTSNIGDLEKNSFFRAVFKAINIDISEILNGYDQYHEFHNPASLSKMRKMINKKIDKLNERFNKLYFAESDEYKFSIDIESEKLSFGMARGLDEDPIMIEMQSTGFRWFFNFYFNFICSNSLSSGDIIVMDEPATHLHPEGQRELRRFIKEFAIKSDLTFIIATHSPFLIDCDNYDELRIVSMSNNRTKIDNLFSAVNSDDPDSLLPIKEALTIKQNVIYDLDSEVIWVEGITDYNYLTMFKKLLNVNDIYFIPYNGNGENDDDEKRVLEKLVGIKFHKRGILVDGDKSGKSMAKLCKNSVFKDSTYMVSNVNPNFKEIEDLFSDEDKAKYDSLNKNSQFYKKSFYSSMMKNSTNISDYSEQTISNFKKLFETFEE